MEEAVARKAGGVGPRVASPGSVYSLFLLLMASRLRIPCFLLLSASLPTSFRNSRRLGIQSFISTKRTSDLHHHSGPISFFFLFLVSQRGRL
jgi:hypothetical protein